MADKKKGAKHLTELTLGIEGIKEALDEAQKIVEEKSKEIGETASKSISSAFNNLNLEKDSDIIDSKKFDELNAKVEKLSGSFREADKVVRTLSQSGEEIKRIETFIDGVGKKTDKYYKLAKDGSTTVSEKITTDYAKIEKEEEKNYKNSVSRLESLIKKQKEFTSLVGEQRTSPINKQLIEDSKSATDAMEKLNEEIKKTGKVSAEQVTQIDNLTSKNKELAGAYEEAGTKGESFLSKISDKAKWLSAFYIVDTLAKSMKEAIGIIQETENAAIELKRVISVDLSQGDIAKQLYSIAEEYGREFDDVQSVAVRFAQAGNEWNDVIKLTESTMLALNTAELDVEQSTQGLIAITSQWNIEAKDTEVLIDKINRTADRFPVTSEKIVAALQRASSSAKNANMTIEETIGVITALSKTTGRSGENIGTALNSLLIYTSKDKALQTFYEVGNDTVKKTVESYKAGAASILDVWKALSENLSELSEQQQRILLSGVDTNELGMHLEEEATEITSDIREIYGSAGTFRQNYLIALLKDIDTVEDVTQGMANVIGYSTRENKEQMKTLAASTKEFKAVWKGLVVDLGEGVLGLKNIAKSATNAGTAVGKLIKNFGGLKPVIVGVTGAITLLKRESIAGALDEIKDGFKKVKEKGTALIQTLKDIKSGSISLSNAFKKAEISSTELATGIGIAELAISALAAVYGTITNAVKEHKQAEAEARQATIENTQEKLEQSKALGTVAERFVELAEKEKLSAEESQELYKTAKELGISLKDVEIGADGAAINIDAFAEALEKAKNVANGLSKAEWENYLKSLEEEFLTVTQKDGFLGRSINNLQISLVNFTKQINETEEKAVDIFSETMDKYKKEIVDAAGDTYTVFEPLAEDAESKIQFLADLKKSLIELNKASAETEGIGKTEVYSKAIAAQEKTDAELRKLIEGQVEFAYAQRDAKTAVDGTSESVNAFTQEIVEAIGIDEVFNKDIKEMVESLLVADGVIPEIGTGLDEFANGIEISQAAIEGLDTGVNALSESLDSMQKGLDTVYNAYAEFNELGYLNLDTIQALIAAGGDYVSCLQFTENGITLNEEATAKLIDAQKANALEMIKQAAVSDALKIVQEHLRAETNNVENASDSLTNTLGVTGERVADLTIKYLNGAIAANEFARESAKAAHMATPGKIDKAALESDLMSAVSGYKGFYDYVQTSFNGIEHYSSKASKGMAKDAKKASSAAKKAASDATKAIKEELNAQKAAVKERYDAEIKEIDKAKKAAQKKYDAAKKALESEKKSIQKSFDAQKDALNDRKDSIKDYYDAQIDALKGVQKENDRLDKQEEYLKRKREAEKDIAKAATRSGVEWREKEAEAKEKLDEVESDRSKELRDQRVEDQIAALEKERDAQIKAIEAQLKGIEQAKEAALESIEAQMEALSTKKEKEMEAFDAKKEKLKEQKEAEVKAIEEQIKKADSANKTMAGNYKTNFLDPTLEATEKGFDRAFGNVEKSFGNLTQKMSREADALASKIGESVEKVKSKANTEMERMKGMQPIKVPSPPAKENPNTGAYYNARATRGMIDNPQMGGTHINNTSNQMIANIFTEAGAKTLGSRFFTRP